MTGRDQVDAYVAKLAPARRTAVGAIRRLICKAAPGIGEEVKWNAPSFRTVESFATLHLRDAKRIGVILHLGARGKPPEGFAEMIPDPEGLLRWLGPDRAWVMFEGVKEIRAKKGAMVKIIRAWVKQVTPNAVSRGRKGERATRG